MKEEDEEGEDDKEKLLATKRKDGPNSKDPPPHSQGWLSQNQGSFP